MSQHQPFRTKLDYSDNRQIKQRQRTFTDLEGGTVFGVAFSALTSGPGPECSAVTETNSVLTGNTFSSNTFTTNYVWSDPRLTAIEPYLSAWTPTNSGTTQQVGNLFFASNTTVIDGNTVVLEYTGVSAEDVYVTTMTQVGASAYTGNVTINIFEALSACSLDYTGRTIWIDNPEITRTKKLIVSENPVPGYVLKSDAEGMATWQPDASGGTSFWTAGTGTVGSMVQAYSNSTSSGDRSVVGGSGNSSAGNLSVILGGFSHSITAGADIGVILGGANHTITSAVDHSAAIGGVGNTVANSLSGIFAGQDNTLSGGVDNWSAIIAGQNNTLTASRSVILGGNSLVGTSNDTVYVPNLNINSIGTGTPVTNLAVDVNGYVVSGTSGGGSFTGNTSATCISDLYVSNIHSCSPLHLNPLDEGNIYMGSSSGFTFDISNVRVGIGTTSPIGKLEVYESANSLHRTRFYNNSTGAAASTAIDIFNKQSGSTFNGGYLISTSYDFTGNPSFNDNGTGYLKEAFTITTNGFPTKPPRFNINSFAPNSNIRFFVGGGNIIDDNYLKMTINENNIYLGSSTSGFSYDIVNEYLGIGTAAPSSNLDLVGSFKYTDGNQQNGYVLTSDASGNATWQVATGGFSGNTSATCITDLWITNLHGCSPITIHDEVQANGSTASGILSFAFGNGVTASGDNSFVAGGRANVASGLYSYAEGFNTSATGGTSHSEGDGTLAGGFASHAEGENTTSNGTGSHSEGQSTVASGNGSHAEGSSTTASEDYAHAEGQSTTSSGVASHAEGNGTTASNAAAHAEGFGGTASGAGSHAEGFETLASGDYSHAEGSATSATTFYAHAAGRLTLVNATGGYASGNNNEITTISDYSAIIGGTNNTIDSNFGVGGTAYDSFIGAGLNNEIREVNYSFIGAGENNFLTSPHSAIVGGKDNTINGLSDYSAMLAGSGNTISSSSSRTVVLGGIGISATTSDTVYVPDLVIDGLTSVTDLQTDSTGRVIDGASDITLKDNIKTITNPLETILKLNPVSFEWKPEINLRPGKVYGLIAQEVKEIIPEIVRERAKGDGTLTLDYKEIVPWLIGAIQELSGDNSPLLNREELILETQTIASEDNNIELNFNGNTESAIDGGITVIKGIDDNTDSEFKINSNGDWITNNYIIPFGMVIPKYTPGSTSDKHGKLGEITRDDSYIYIKTESGWLRSNLETF